MADVERVVMRGRREKRTRVELFTLRLRSECDFRSVHTPIWPAHTAYECFKLYFTAFYCQSDSDHKSKWIQYTMIIFVVRFDHRYTDVHICIHYYPYQVKAVHIHGKHDTDTIDNQVVLYNMAAQYEHIKKDVICNICVSIKISVHLQPQ